MPSIARAMPIGGNLSTSAPVSTATTPGAPRAASTSSAASLACACGLRTNTTCATSSSRRSSRKRPSPRSSGGSSGRRVARPTWLTWNRSGRGRASWQRPDCTITPMCRPTRGMTRAWGGLVLGAVLVALAATDVSAQVFVSATPRPDIAIGPLFVGATAPSDFAAPVNVSVTWNLVQRPDSPAYNQTLGLLWPSEIAAATAAGPVDPALVNYVESRGFTSTSSGRLMLRTRSQSQLGLPTPAEDLAVRASYLSFIRRDAPPQAGTGALIWIPPTPPPGGQPWALNPTAPGRGMTAPKPASWLEDVFWGRRNALALSWGDVGSITFYPLYHEHRDRIVPLAREYSRLLVSFPDA